jgi:hypothetical protein
MKPASKGMSKELQDAIKNSRGGLSTDPRDYPQPDDEGDWVEALYDLQLLGNKKPLQYLFRSANLPGKVGEYLADLIERGVKGRKRTPA